MQIACLIYFYCFINLTVTLNMFNIGACADIKTQD